MTVAFLDTSALAKRYIVETGSTWIKNQVISSPNNEIIISELAIVEMFSFIARRHREGAISATDKPILQRDFLLHVDKQYVVIRLNSGIVAQARGLIDKYVLKALDAIQLASVVAAFPMFKQPIQFISADQNLLAAATTEGFATDNLLRHP